MTKKNDKKLFQYINAPVKTEIAAVILVAIVALVSFFYFKTSPSTTLDIPIPSTVSQSTLKTFKSSSVMDFTIEVPSKYTIEEKFTTVTITSQNEEISIRRSGTNSSNLDDYLSWLSKMNKLIINNKTKISVNNLSAIHATVEGKNMYFIYIDNFVYSISTNSKLDDDLDQIAQSFRYTPY